MAIQYRQRGSGITREPELVFGGTRQDIRDTLFHAAETRTFEGFIREIEANARAILKDAGFDPDNRQCFTVPEDDSPEDFCDRILTWIELARRALANGDAEGAVRAGFQIGSLVCAHDMKFQWEKPALAGSKTLKGSSDGGRRRAAALKSENSARDVEMARKFQQLRKTRVSATALKERIGKQRGLGRSASVAAIDRGLKLLSGAPGKTDEG